MSSTYENLKDAYIVNQALGGNGGYEIGFWDNQPSLVKPYYEFENGVFFQNRRITDNDGDFFSWSYKPRD